MSQHDVEIKIASDYVEEIEDELERLRTSTGNWAIEGDIHKKLDILRHHLQSLSTQFPDDSDVIFYQSILHYLHGRLALLSEGFVNSVARGGSTNPSNSGNVVADLGSQFIFGMIANNEDRKTILNAIPHYSKAISIYDSEFYRINRARLYWLVDDFSQALTDLSGILDDPEGSYYLDARKLRDKIIAEKASTKTESSSWCFIATAIYGSPDAPEVLVLRQFRDEVLLQSVVGRWFVRVYYAMSPGVAGWLGRREWLRSVLRRWVFDWVVGMCTCRVGRLASIRCETFKSIF